MFNLGPSPFSLLYKYSFQMSKLNMFITAFCVLFLIKLRWPKNQRLENRNKGLDVFHAVGHLYSVNDSVSHYKISYRPGPGGQSHLFVFSGLILINEVVHPANNTGPTTRGIHNNVFYLAILLIYRIYLRNKK